MKSKKFINYQVDKRAGEIACSLISEGYRLLWRYSYGICPRVSFGMHHAQNGNTIRVEVDECRVAIWKNSKLIKTEPLA